MSSPLLDFLSTLENTEATLLTWGVVDSAFRDDDLFDRAQRFLEERPELWDQWKEAEDLVDELIERRLIVDVSFGRGERWRTRMAETIRLLARLRQLFPGRDWQTAPALVADYRFTARPRSYPRRHLPPEALLAELDAVEELPGVGAASLKAMLGVGTPKPFLLADFQREATRQVLQDLSAERSRGVIVGAGTGSGKTLAFYLPALTHIAGLIDASHWVKCVSIYPRNELLKDQLSETCRMARRIQPALQQHERRPLLIGAFFGDTPHNVSLLNDNWEPRTNGWSCPYLRCPACEGELIWPRADRAQKRERLVCLSARCGATVEEDTIVLTRERMMEVPPDILFTSTEMLNQRMSDSRFAHLFGVGPGAPRKPPLALLDEVHTYSGVHGAQVSYLLRRWRHALGQPVVTVGLSATLRDARRFFAGFVGLSEEDVRDIAPVGSEEIIEEGMEYLLALRGDPVSGASLLSTTIQTAMLMRRVLDPPGQPVSGGAFGSKAFLFTDDLDVTNRLYFDMLDAEGLDSWNRAQPRGSLANLRAPDAGARGPRASAGQSWDLCERIGHQLSGSPLRVGRTSSQDAGVDATANLIVATASLEVGFNDPEVGAVIQHKAPMGVAQLLQRKGRAGRQRGMRPWMVVVLSDYGRDRLAYQSYDQLFDPALPPNPLPLANRYVLRMQAVYATMDWFFRQLQTAPSGSVWSNCAVPADPNYPRQRQRQQLLATLVEGILRDEVARLSLTQHLSHALHVSPEIAEALLWEPPRALLTEALPTLLRRLKSGWRGDRPVSNAPLPEFVPSNLFSPLALPEVIIHTPAQQQNVDDRDDPMPVLQAMRTFAPGRVSRRFGVEHRYARHWIAPPLLDGTPEQDLPIEQCCTDSMPLGTMALQGETGLREIPVFRPLRMEPQRPPHQVRDSSNSTLVWHTQILPTSPGLSLAIPRDERWSRLIREIRFFAHNQMSNLEVRRFATGAHASIGMMGGEEIEAHIRFTAEDRPAALGFVSDVDGMVIRLRLPDDLRLLDAQPEKLRAFRTALFRHRVLKSEALPGVNTFRRGWLSQAYITALACSALELSCTLEEACRALQTGAAPVTPHGVLDVLFQTLSDDEDGRQRVHQHLSALLADPHIRQVLHEEARVLWAVPDEEWTRWARERFKATLGAAFLDACQRLCPEFDVRDLLLDIQPGPRADLADLPAGIEEIWLTETTLGGGGLLEAILARYGEDPRRFFQLVESALAPSDFEILDGALGHIVTWAVEQPDFQQVLHGLREDVPHGVLQQRLSSFRHLLTSRGLLLSHPVMVAINARILRPGSSEATDRILYDLLERWRQAEERLGIEVDARLIAFLASGDDALEQALGGGLAGVANRRQWRFSNLYGLLWPRGSVVRENALSTYNPFAELPPADRLLVLDCLPDPTRTVQLQNEAWHAQVNEALQQNGQVRLAARLADTRTLQAALAQVLAEPVDMGALLLPVVVRGVQRGNEALLVTLELSEALQ